MMASAAPDPRDASPHDGTGPPHATPPSPMPAPLATPSASPPPTARRCLLVPASSSSSYSSSAPTSTPLSARPTPPTPLSAQPTPLMPLSAQPTPTPLSLHSLLSTRPPPTPTQTPRYVLLSAMPPASTNFPLSQPLRHASAHHFGPPPPVGPMLGQKLKHQPGLTPLQRAITATPVKPKLGRPKGSTSKTTTGTAIKKQRTGGKRKGTAATKSNNVAESDGDDDDEEEDELAVQGTRTTTLQAKSAAVATIDRLFADYPEDSIDSDFEPKKRGSKGGGKTSTVTTTPTKGKNKPAVTTSKNLPRKVVLEEAEEEEVDEIEIDELKERTTSNNDDGDDDFLPTPTRPPAKPERTSARLRHEPAPNLSVPATRKRAAPKTKEFTAELDVELDDLDRARADAIDADGEPPRKKRATVAAAKESLPMEEPIDHDASSDTDDMDDTDPHAAVHESQVELTQPLADPPRPPPSLERGPSPALPARRTAPAANGGGTASRSTSPASPAPARARLPPKLPPARSQRAGSAVWLSLPAGSAVSDAPRSSSPAAPPQPPPRAGSTRPARPTTPIAMSASSSEVAPSGSKSQRAMTRVKSLGPARVPMSGSQTTTLAKAKLTSSVPLPAAAQSQPKLQVRVGLSRATAGTGLKVSSASGSSSQERRG